MPGPHGLGHFPDDDQGPFRDGNPGEDGMGSLAMGMDVDIPAASTSGDRREAERQRGRESRCAAVLWRCICMYDQVACSLMLHMGTFEGGVVTASWPPSIASHLRAASLLLHINRVQQVSQGF